MTEGVRLASTIGPLLVSDVDEAVSLIKRSFLTCVAPLWSSDAVDRFVVDDLSESKILGFIRSGFICLKYVCSGAITGVLIFSSHKKLAYLFVHPQHQKQGVAKLLFLEARRLLSPEVDYIELVSSEYAVNVYGNLGFKASAVAFKFNGCVFQPMVYWMGNDRLADQVEFLS